MGRERRLRNRLARKTNSRPWKEPPPVVFTKNSFDYTINCFSQFHAEMKLALPALFKP